MMVGVIRSNSVQMIIDVGWRRYSQKRSREQTSILVYESQGKTFATTRAKSISVHLASCVQLYPTSNILLKHTVYQSRTKPFFWGWGPNSVESSVAKGATCLCL